MISYFKFPAGEVHIKEQQTIPFSGIQRFWMPSTATENLNLNDRLIALMLRCRMYEAMVPNFSYDIVISYLPYSRQDRPTSKEEPFSLKLIGDILGVLKYRKCYTFDVHSDVAYGCIRNLENVPVETILQNFALDLKKFTLVIPDQGAYKKLAKLEHLFSNTIVALKQRNISDGRVVIKELIGDIKGKNCLIVDDLCDGGSTFTQLASELWKKDANSVDLYVTHGIFSRGLQPLFDSGISNIYTTDSYYYGDGYRSENGFKNLIVSNCRSIFNNFCWSHS